MLVKNNQQTPADTTDRPLPSSVQDILDQLDNSHISRFHWKAMITSGMGFLTDAYDLFIIGAALAILTPLWHLTPLEVSLLASTSLIAAALGSVIFGHVADRLGRKFIYGYELVVLAIGAIASALSPNVTFLLLFRFILGMGIGGDYPVSATLMSEYSNRRDRGKMITLVFSMQGVGLILGPLIAIALLKLGLNQEWTWRIMLGLGALPAMATFYMRRQIAETPRFALAQGNMEEVARSLNAMNGRQSVSKEKSQHNGHTQPQKKRSSWRTLLGRPYLRWLIGTAGTWFLLDIAYYGTTISSPLVLKAFNPHNNQITNMLLTLTIFVIAALPGYILAAFTIDRLGRKRIQLIGFALMALMYAFVALIPAVSASILLFLPIFSLSYFFTEFGPNVTTFVYPAEIFPVMVRTTGHGISAALGKVGAFIGAFAFPFLLLNFHLQGAMAFSAIVSLAGLILTVFTLPEPNGRSLEEISGDSHVLAGDS